MAALFACLVAASPAAAFTFFDGKIEVHGFVGQQIRAIGNDFDAEEEFDLAQWYNVLDLEVEAKPFPRGIGPLEIVEFYVRAEARYDCVWTRACGLFPSANTYGNRADHLPPRLINGRYAGFNGTLTSGDRRYYTQVDRENYTLAGRTDRPRNDQEPLRFSDLPGIVSLFGNSFGPNQVFEPFSKTFGDDPATFHLSQILDRCKFGGRTQRGGENSRTFSPLGPWNPSCPIRENAALRFSPNPFANQDVNPVLMGVDRTPDTGDEPIDPFTGGPTVPVGRRELPYRPAPFHSNALRGLSLDEAQGLYLPSAALVREVKSGKLDSIDQNFGQQDLAWNRGASQQDEYELKEAYADIEAFEGRLWMRLGKQTIVWGKTELFRNTDQFNPQDFAMASIPGLEESRIALWAARGTWSFYNIGKFEDVRLELAVNLDDMQPADLGRCGEPFSVELVCGISFGYFAHGLTGAGLAGQDKPPAPWEEVKGVEAGARVEWRYKRFSFQVSDFYGYDDFPYPRRISTYERNVDPTTGRPRRFGDHGPCTTGAEPSCLGRPNAVMMGSDGEPVRFADTDLDGIPDTLIERSSGDQYWNVGQLVIDPAHKSDVLRFQSANQTAFAFANILCGAAGEADPGLCGLAALNGLAGPGAPISTVANGASALIGGNREAASAAAANGFLCTVRGVTNFGCSNQVGNTLVRINRDPGDAVGVFSDGGVSIFALGGFTLGGRLTPQQEALWGCGPFFQSDCDVDGVDMLNAEMSVVLQSWPGFEGSVGTIDAYDLRDTTIHHPGTANFVGGPVATRYVDGEVVMLPGSRGPSQAGYDATVDGCVGPGVFGCNAGDNGRATAAVSLMHPSGQQFRSELAATSYNWMIVSATGGRELVDPDLPAIDEFDPFDPQGLGIITRGPNAGQVRAGVDPALADGVTPVACGLRKIALCRNVRGFLSASGVRRNSVRAAGANGFGRRDFPWHSGGELVLDYEKRNVLGFAFDFDEDKTKSNWGVEATWVNKQPFVNNDAFDGISKVDTINLTVSVDRPTFINFLNPGRTFFFNSQIFVQYINEYQDNFYANGPLNVLATFTVFTGYFQDRLMFFNTAVYDVNSASGALLPSISYRFTENFSATVGANVFFGRQELRDSAINEIRPALNRVGSDAYKDPVETGLSAVREHDELYFLLRYTF